MCCIIMCDNSQIASHVCGQPKNLCWHLKHGDKALDPTNVAPLGHCLWTLDGGPFNVKVVKDSKKKEEEAVLMELEAFRGEEEEITFQSGGIGGGESFKPTL